jgi:hypothetical protein
MARVYIPARVWPRGICGYGCGYRFRNPRQTRYPYAGFTGMVGCPPGHPELAHPPRPRRHPQCEHMGVSFHHQLVGHVADIFLCSVAATPLAPKQVHGDFPHRRCPHCPMPTHPRHGHLCCPPTPSPQTRAHVGFLIFSHPLPSHPSPPSPQARDGAGFPCHQPPPSSVHHPHPPSPQM